MRTQFNLALAIAGFSLKVGGLPQAAQLSSSPQPRQSQEQPRPQPQSGAALPSPEAIERSVKKAYESAKGDGSGKNADYIPVLAKVPSELFGIGGTEAPRQLGMK